MPGSPTIEAGRGHARRAVDLAVLTGGWLLVCWLVGVHGDFPLNDDWSYQEAVRRLLAEGRFHPTGWTSMPLLTHTLWGALFCLPLGVSSVALRVSTLTMGLLGLFATRALLREVGAGRRASLFGALVVGGNPMYVALAFTYMTDLPFVTIGTAACWLFARSLRRRSRRTAVLATGLLLVATLNRQVGLLVAIGYAAALLRRDGVRRDTLLRASCPLACAVAALLALQWWLTVSGALPAEFSTKSRAILTALTDPVTLARTAGEGAFVALLYLGLMLLPITLVANDPRPPRRARVFGVAVAALMGAVLVWRGRMMPLGFNTVMPAGVGPDLLRDTYLLSTDNLPALPTWFWLAVTIASLVGVELLVTRVVALLLTLLPSSAHGAVVPRTLLLTAVAAGIVPVIAQQHLDRYLLPFVPLLAAAALARDPAGEPPLPAAPWLRVLARSSLVAFAVFAVAGTHDWLERTRVRWQAIAWLESSQHATPDTLDGGMEYGGSRRYDPDYRPSPEHSWWWVHDDRFVVAMGPLPGYRIARAFPVANWIGPPQRIVALERER